MSANAIARPVPVNGFGIARQVAVATLLVVLIYRAGLFAAAGIEAVLYPYELDYGEGIVWQQMRLIFTERAYGPIDQLPAIVFHYTPFYHAVTWLVAGTFGTDELATGRTISLLSTVAAAGASAWLVVLLMQGSPVAMRRLCASTAGLLPFIYPPVIGWAPLMRVDMLAIALGLFGLVATFKALDRPRLIYLAAFLFVASIYTKQTSIAAPAAAFGILLAMRPRLAVRGIVACLVLGLVLLAALAWATDGGFIRHIFLYNVNRADLSRLSWIWLIGASSLILILLAGAGVAHRLAGACLRDAATADIRLLIAAAYLAITTLMLLLVMKSGSSINYFLEWFFALGLFAALAVSPRQAPTAYRRVFAIGAPLALALQGFTAPLPPVDDVTRAVRAPERAQLLGDIAAARKPVISDDMVLLLRGGQEVSWESAIFAELASTGAWDERPFVRRIHDGDFAFFVTWGERGHDRFDERYNPAVADAIEAAYPEKQQLAGLTVHRRRAD